MYVASAHAISTSNINTLILRTLDQKISWSYQIRKRFTVQPSAGSYNLFNFANFDLPGTGAYALGAPRPFEFGLSSPSSARPPLASART